MKHVYQISGMTCKSCEAKVTNDLLLMPSVLSATVSKETGTAVITMSEHVPVSEFQKALGGNSSKYQISLGKTVAEESTASKSWFDTYKPVLLIFGYVSIISVILSLNGQEFDLDLFMRIFMSGFFLAFSFFKMLDVRAFAQSYAMYDVIAKRVYAWGLVYPFVEFALGVSFALNFAPLYTNMITFIVMFVSIIGVLQSVLSGSKIKCACLGSVFNLPMTTVTIIEDGLMIAMSGVMILSLSGY